jgi:type IV secretion system protein VirD4
MQGEQPATLYLAVPSADISLTTPLSRFMLNQIAKWLTEHLDARTHRHRMLLMLDDFPSLGHLDFFESGLAFMAAYRLKSVLIARSLDQIEKAYGLDSAIFDNCQVRAAFATKDERTARRVSDALGTAIELCAMNDYTRRRLSPEIGELVMPRQVIARPLLTPADVMQVPPNNELVLVSGIPPIRAHSVRYEEDMRLKSRIVSPPALTLASSGTCGDRPVTHADDWSPLPTIGSVTAASGGSVADSIADPQQQPSADWLSRGFFRQP